MADGRRRADSGEAGWVLALLIAVGIGLHNFGEGLAIGSGVRPWRGGARHAAHRRLHAAQHDRRAGDRGAAGARRGQTLGIGGAGATRADRRRADDRGRVARRLRLFAGLVGAVSGVGVGAIAQVIGQIARQVSWGAIGSVPALASGRCWRAAGGLCGDVRHGDAGRMSIMGRRVSIEVVVTAGGGA